MNKIIYIFLALALIGIASTANAQRFAITKYTIDSGGGKSSGGSYSITGTIGQPDASGVSAGGKYTVAGGYWGGKINLVPTPGAPELTIAKSGKTSVLLKWNDPSGAWKLQESSQLTKASWKTSGRAVANQQGERSVTIPLPQTPVYFRLQGASDEG